MKRHLRTTLYAPHKREGYSGAIIRFIGGSSVIVSVIVIVSVAGDRAGKVFLCGHEEGGDGSRLVPLSDNEAGAAENLPGLFAMLLKGAAEEGGEFVASLSLVLVVLLRFGRLCALRGARCFGAVRCAWSAFLAPSKLASTYGLDVCKS